MFQPDFTQQSQLAAVDDACLIPVNQFTTLRFQVSGTFTGTWVAEASRDNFTTTQPLYCFSNAATPAKVTTGTTTGVWVADIAGWAQVRIRCSALSSGSILVNAAGTLAISTSGMVQSLSEPGLTTTVSSYTATTTSGTALAANTSRASASFYNSGSVDVYLLVNAGTASATNLTQRIAAGGTYELVQHAKKGCFQGLITAIAASATAALIITEYV